MAYLLTLRHDRVEQLLETGHPPVQVGHIHLLACLLAGDIDCLAVLPLDLLAEERLDPVVDCVLDVLGECEVAFLDAVAVLVLDVDALGHQQLVPVLVEGV